VLQVYHLIGELHRHDNIQHVGGLSDLFLFQELEMIQAGPANQDMKSPCFEFLQWVQGFGTFNGQLDTGFL